MNKAQNPQSEIRDPRSVLRLVPLTFYLLSFVFCLSLCPAALAQMDDDMPADAVPPPIKTLSKDEKTSLDAQNSNIKKRTKLSLELMDARMLRAEKYHAETNFKDSLSELAGFQAILDNALEFLIRNDSGKTDRSFINFEIYLRKQVPRLEAIRREMPVKYGYYVGRLMKVVREARAKAVEPLFDDSVLPASASKKP